MIGLCSYPAIQNQQSDPLTPHQAHSATCDVHFDVERVHSFIDDVKELSSEVGVRILTEDITGPAIVGDGDGCLPVLRVLR